MVTKRRIQLDLDEVGCSQLFALQSSSGSASYSEAIRKLLDLSTLLHNELKAGKIQLDMNIVRQMLFSRDR